MPVPTPIYLAIDLKSFYASVECVDRKLDPLTTNLVVADEARTEKTICLAVSPSLKALGLSGRPRLFEVREKIGEINATRRRNAPGGRFHGRSFQAPELAADAGLELDYLAAKPRMARYLAVSAGIYEIYLKYFAPMDIHVYSIDEVFLDITQYLQLYHASAHQLAVRLLHEVLRTTGITATAGLGTNLFLAKVAMDIVAKHLPADAEGVRLAELDEGAFRRRLWGHRPLTDFWRIGPGIAHRLEMHGMRTLGDVARVSLENEEVLYRLFGKNAELLIDHAWGWEPCTLAVIKAYRPAGHSLSSGQVLSEPYDFAHAHLVLREMADGLALELVEKRLETQSLALYVGYDTANLPQHGGLFAGEPLRRDHYGRLAPWPAQGSLRLPEATSSGREIVAALSRLFEQVVDSRLLVRRIIVCAGQVLPEGSASLHRSAPKQLELFADDCAQVREAAEQAVCEERKRERRRQEAVLSIRSRFGKNALLKGMNLEEKATARQRNAQIGGHCA